MIVGLALYLLHSVLISPSPLRAENKGEADPFADLAVPVKSSGALERPARSWAQSFFSDNFSFRKEMMSQFSYSQDRKEDHDDLISGAASRQSLGFETLKKFSSETSTLGSFDFQGRLVRRDRFVGTINDNEGMRRPGWFFEYHNAYMDIYNILDPLMSDQRRGDNLGRFNFRAGRFYVPFGLNLKTDTHATVLQLSNERNFGFERDWYAGFWGNLCEDLSYDAYYLAGSGYDLKFKGQSGLAAARLSLAGKYSADYGLEGGLSYLAGQRLSTEAAMRSPAVMADAGNSNRVDTARAGVDGRYRQPVPTGTLTWASELSGGRDASDSVFTQLHQLDYLHASRRWGLSAQFRRFWQDMSRSREIAPSSAPGEADSSVFAEATWYFRNDVGNANLHWIKLNVERQTERMLGRRDVIVTLQYYRYW